MEVLVDRGRGSRRAQAHGGGLRAFAGVGASQANLGGAHVRHLRARAGGVGRLARRAEGDGGGDGSDRVYWKLVWHVLDGHVWPDGMLLVNPAHIKAVPGRKTDVNDATWIAQLLECGLLTGSFVPPAVRSSASSIRRCVRFGKRSRRPITCTRTPCSINRSSSLTRYLSSRPKIARTSPAPRCQLSEENAYNVRYGISSLRTASTARRTA